ncbi:MAG: reactive intermediate/imine deaminase [Bdellovibrio sp.]|nr:MAG: reactive intermediate/imine deaminase [Bdellovibrio sp.]
MKKAILTPHAPAPLGPYSQAVEQGGFVFLSGQIGLDPKTGNVVSDDVKAQCEQVMKNIEEVLKAAGLSFKQVVKSTIFLVDIKDFTVVNEIYGRHFQEIPPARSTIGVSALPKGVKVEIEVLASRN